MGVFIDDLVRVEFHLKEAAVSLVSMGLWGDTHSHPHKRVCQPDSERLEDFDRLSGMVIFRIYYCLSGDDAGFITTDPQDSCHLGQK